MMNMDRQTAFISHIEAHQGIINKLIGLYADNADDRNDLRQEILLQSWKGYKSFKGGSAFSTWLYRVALNTCLSFHKKNRTTEEITDHAATDPQERYDQKEQLYYIIKGLNEVDKMLITLHLDGFKNPEIANITGLTVNHINVKLHRIKTSIISTMKIID
jgi:RNA polymerase sigma-70 factor (ECF subfamily)